LRVEVLFRCGFLALEAIDFFIFVPISVYLLDYASLSDIAIEIS